MAKGKKTPRIKARPSALAQAYVDGQKRKLRIAKRVKYVPALGICEYCQAQFPVDPKVGNALSAIREQFNAHKCKRLDLSPPESLS